ncbi:MAG: lysophospholipid acyltransferase family protein [Acidobacteriota bacterium]|nr:lysophospholipid acyltransferase family protein [Acidobacteriota bacterium]
MQRLLSTLMYGFFRLLGCTYRYRHVGIEHLREAARVGPAGSYLLGIWHHNVLAGILAQTGGKYVVIVSRSRDAEPVALACSRLGHIVVRGSSKRGGVYKGGREAKEEMVELLKKGYPGSVTVDGPKGPPREVKPGIVDMARESGAPLVPYVPIPDRCWTLRSWDSFRLPKPFARILVQYGRPIPVAPTVEGEEFLAFQSSLGRLLDEGEQTARLQFANWKTLARSQFPLAPLRDR